MVPVKQASEERNPVLRRELLLFTALLFAGTVILPAAIFAVGGVVFGDYGGGGYAHFFSTLTSKIRQADVVAWLLVLSPYLAVQGIRLVAAAWRAVGEAR